MHATRSNQSSLVSGVIRARKKHIHAECGEPIKGHHRLNGALVCLGAENQALAAPTSNGTLLPGSEALQPFSQSQFQSSGFGALSLEDLEFAMEQSLQLLREAKRRMPGKLHEHPKLPRREGYPNSSWTEVAIAAVDTIRDLWKFTFIALMLLLWSFSYVTRNVKVQASPAPCIVAA
ncbi:hypothetical protein B0H16DRAFT_1539773 [Mycena metata]|uniref:Uncharacterized protein n=1 Tax=Mycena metata TaxID=1033252 RepID=A0AAD7J2W3_9AGAR|nr:hypothetical protein B0H16DRAFT_1539773 [Mycena metata]